MGRRRGWIKGEEDRRKPMTRKEWFDADKTAKLEDVEGMDVLHVHELMSTASGFPCQT